MTVIYKSTLYIYGTGKMYNVNLRAESHAKFTNNKTITSVNSAYYGKKSNRIMLIALDVAIRLMVLTRIIGFIPLTDKHLHYCQISKGVSMVFGYQTIHFTHAIQLLSKRKVSLKMEHPEAKPTKHPGFKRLAFLLLFLCCNLHNWVF